MAEKCLSEDEFRQIIRSTCSSEQQDRYAAHLDECEICRQQLERFAGNVAASSAVAQTTPALSCVMARLTQLERSGATTGRFCDTIVDFEFPYLESSVQPESLGRLGKYEVTRQLGRGGMGVVFAALDTSLGREVAIKIPSPSLTSTSEAHQRFMREARAIAAVKHDNIVTVHAAEQTGDTLLLVMELIEGESLARRLSIEKRLPWQDAVRIGSEVAAALDAAHARGIVHRDIKPGNILLEKSTGRVKVTDFGLAKASNEPGVTTTGVLAGTPEYMSPEQATEGTVSPRSDLFSLGTVLYHACGGDSPFQSATALSTLRSVVDEEPPPLHQIDSGIPLWFSDLISRMMAKEPEDRPRSAREVQAVLESRGEATPAAHSDRVHASSNTRRVALASGAALIGLVAAAVYFAPQRSPSIPLPSRDAEFSVGNAIYESLQAAIEQASDGATIEILGDGPYRVSGIDAGNKSLSIVASPLSRPVFQPLDEFAKRPFLTSTADLKLERIEVHWPLLERSIEAIERVADHCVIAVSAGKLNIDHCRLIAGPTAGCVGCQSASAEIVNSHFVSPTGPCLIWNPRAASSLQATNCVWQGKRAAIVLICHGKPEAERSQLTLTRNSFSTRWVAVATLEKPMQQFDVTIQRNACDADLVLMTTRGESIDGIPTLLQMRTAVRSNLNWTESENGYRRGIDYLSRGIPTIPQMIRPKQATLDDWLWLWEQQESGSFETDFVDIGSTALPAALQFENLRIPIESAPVQVGADLSRVGPMADDSLAAER